MNKSRSLIWGDDMSNETKDGNGSSNQPTSLRDIVRKNDEALHKMASRLGDVNLLYKKFDELKASIDKQTESNNKLTRVINDFYDKTDKHLGDYGTNVRLIDKSVTELASRSQQEAIAIRDQKKSSEKGLEQLIKEIKNDQEAAGKRQHVIITLLAILCTIFFFIAWNLSSHSSIKSDSTEVSAPVPESAPEEPQEQPTPAQPQAGKSKKKKQQ